MTRIKTQIFLLYLSMKLKIKSNFFGLFFVLALFGLYSLQHIQHPGYARDEIHPNDITLEAALVSLGAEKLPHYIKDADHSKALMGKELIEKGRVKKGLFKSKIISPYFVCTDCHNQGREFENANDQSPEKRLAYAKKNNLPFLPGSTFWGIYNRTDFYNDDYIKKYGDIILPAKKSLEQSIQVCAKYCSAGRNLKDWEVEAIMHYFKENELRLKDVNLGDNQKKNILKAQYLTNEEKSNLLKVLRLSYVSGYTAHFMGTMPVEDRKYGKLGDAENGKFIFENACLFCHKDGRVTYLKLDNDKLTGRMFVNHMEGFSDRSVYQIIRWGTYTMPGRNQYMPRYTKEKMSDEQIEDLMAYLQLLADK